ncbi:MAG: hypothetical protein LBD88_04935 [Candidatus Peribacteria bacterium]|nr:hypothetical protein [Candidatus Peribacteria bacterium]
MSEDLFRRLSDDKVVLLFSLNFWLASEVKLPFSSILAIFFSISSSFFSISIIFLKASFNSSRTSLFSLSV